MISGHQDIKTVVFVGLWILFFGFSSHAWMITKELQKEINEKKAAVLKKTNDPNAHFDLAITYAYTNQIQAGWDELRKVNEIDPNYKNYAQNVYVKKVIDKPDDWRLRFRLAFAFYFAGRKTEAIRELENVLLLDPYNVFACGYISLIYGEMDQIDKSIEYARKGIKIDYQVAALHLLLAEGYYKKNDTWNGFWERTTAIRLKLQGF